MQQDFSRPAAPLPPHRLKTAVFVQKNRGICKAKAVYGLFNVANHKKVSFVLGDAAENQILHGVYILILVNHDLRVALRKLAGKLCCLSRLLVAKQANGKMLKVGEIQKIEASFLSAVELVKFKRQTQQRVRRGRCCCHVGKQLFRRCVKHRLQRLHRLFAAVARGSKHYFPVLKFIALQRSQSRKVNRQTLARCVPANIKRTRKLTKLLHCDGKTITVC